MSEDVHMNEPDDEYEEEVFNYLPKEHPITSCLL